MHATATIKMWYRLGDRNSTVREQHSGWVAIQKEVSHEAGDINIQALITQMHQDRLIKDYAPLP